MQFTLMALLFGFLLDLIIGDPNQLWHPVRGIGKLIQWTEKLLRSIFGKKKEALLIAGAVLVLVVLIISSGIPFVILYLLYRWHPGIAFLIEIIFCTQLLATKSLKDESMKVHKALEMQTLEEARNAVSRIVGRDTKSLDREGIMKATVETVAENTSDGSIAPMFYMAIGGPVLGFLYKAVNTMDSMVGYKNEKYIYFGRVAAKLDDLLNYIPSRVSAYLMIIASFILGYPVKAAIRIYLRDRYHHASPNSAQTEAVMAGALQIQLGGDAFYFGVLHSKQTIGDQVKKVESKDIKRANQLLYVTAILGICLFCTAKMVVLISIGVITF